MIGRRHFALMAGSALAWPAARANAVWRLASGYSAESFHTVNLMAMARETETLTQGELRIAVYPNNSLVKLNEVRTAVQDGRAEAGETIMSSLVGEMPIAGADSVPFITDSYDDARRMWRHQRPLIERMFAERGMQVLYAVAWPPQGLYAGKPIERLMDLKGSRMRTYNQTTASIARWLGAQPVDLPMAEVGRAMADGRIDSMITSAVTGVENRVWSHMRYYYDIKAWFPKNIVFANALALKNLSPAARGALLAASNSAENRGWAASAAAASSSVDELRRNGIKVEHVSHEVNVDLRRLGERFTLAWIHQVGSPANDVFIPYFSTAK